MKISREEKIFKLIPESEWEYNQLKDLNWNNISIKGFEDCYGDTWKLQGGLVIEIKDAYND